MKSAAIPLVCLLAASVAAETIRVGPGHPFESIETAYAKAEPGDVIEIYPRAEGVA